MVELLLLQTFACRHAITNSITARVSCGHKHDPQGTYRCYTVASSSTSSYKEEVLKRSEIAPSVLLLLRFLNPVQFLDFMSASALKGLPLVAACLSSAAFGLACTTVVIFVSDC